MKLPDDLIADVVSALNRAIGLAMHKAPELVDGFSAVATRLDDAINEDDEKE
jgi:hypothetical protein